MMKCKYWNLGAERISKIWAFFYHSNRNIIGDTCYHDNRNGVDIITSHSTLVPTISIYSYSKVSLISLNFSKLKFLKLNSKFRIDIYILTIICQKQFDNFDTCPKPCNIFANFPFKWEWLTQIAQHFIRTIPIEINNS